MGIQVRDSAIRLTDSRVQDAHGAGLWLAGARGVRGNEVIGTGSLAVDDLMVADRALIQHSTMWSAFYPEAGPLQFIDNSISSSDRYGIVADGHCPTGVTLHIESGDDALEDNDAGDFVTNAGRCVDSVGIVVAELDQGLDAPSITPNAPAMANICEPVSEELPV